VRRRTTRRSPVRRNRRKTTRRTARRTARRSPVRRRRRSVSQRRPVRRNRRRTTRRYRRNQTTQLMNWIQTGGLIAAGVVGHKLFSGFLKNLLVAKAPTAAASPAVDNEVENGTTSGLGILPAALTPYAGIISGGAAAALGVYLTMKMVKKPETRKLVAGGMVASFLHTLIVDLLRKQAPEFAQSISGLGASDASAARLSAMYGVGSSIQPMYSPIGEYFSSGVGEYFSSGLGNVAPYEAQAGMGEYFSSGVGAYENNPDMMQAAAGMGALETANTNHLNPSSDLERELSIAEAAAGVGSTGPMQAAAGLGDVRSVAASQTWIPGESDPQIWAGTRSIDRSQESTAMVPSGVLNSGGNQGVFG